MFPAIWHRYLFLFGLMSLACGMLFGNFLTSVPQFILAGNWFLEKNYVNKWRQLKSNRFFWILSSLFFLHLFGMIYTENIPRGLEDLKTKVPLFSLPLILLSTKPLTMKEFKLLFGFFFLSVVVSSVCCFLVYAGYTKKTVIDARDASVFISHIRFSLFIAFAVIGCFYFAIKTKKIAIKLLCVLAIIWLLFFMYRLEMATGFVCLLCTCVILGIFYSIKHFHKFISAGVILVIVVVSFFVVTKALSSLNLFNESKHNSANTLLQQTKNGRHYLQDTLFGLAENGNLITININDTELKKEWELRSNLAFSDHDKKGNNLRFTILRYLASKGLSKDSLGINSLNKQDVYNIENGITNYKYTLNSGLIARWREFVWEYTKYKRGENPSGHTLTMRLEFWETASYIIKKHPLFGVGTGDIQDSFNKAYIETNSKLDMAWRLRCHNQYLAIWVAFGVFGLILFFVYLVYPAVILLKRLHYLYWPFLVIIILSFITEDTLETQTGVTFFSFFQTLFVWLASYGKDKKDYLTEGNGI